MKLSLFLQPHSPAPQDDARVVHAALRQAQLADALGFAGVWLSEHNFTGESAFGDPIGFADAIAVTTERIEIGFAVIQLTLHHPVRLAIQLALLDQLSNGRLRVGVARGSSYNEWEYAGFGMTIADGREQFDEALELLLRAWTEPDLEFVGKYHRASVPAIRPTTVQKPHPPIYRSAITLESTAEIGRLGLPIQFARLTGPMLRERLTLYEASARAAGHSAERVELLLREAAALKSVYVAPTDDEAWADIAAPTRRHLRFIAESKERYSKSPTPPVDRRPTDPVDPELAARIPELTPAMARGLIVGSPETVRRALAEQERYGLHHVLASMNWGDMPFDKVERSMRLLMTEVMPGLEPAAAVER